MCGNEMREDGNECVACVSGFASACGRKPLAGWPADEHISPGKLNVPRQGNQLCAVIKVRTIGANGRLPIVGCIYNVESGHLEAERKTAGSTKKVNDGWAIRSAHRRLHDTAVSSFAPECEVFHLAYDMLCRGTMLPLR